MLLGEAYVVWLGVQSSSILGIRIASMTYSNEILKEIKYIALLITW